MNDLIYNIKISNKKLLETIKDRLNNKIPTSIVRKSDGENIMIGYRKIKGIKKKWQLNQ